jgi:hypothetical protein
MKTNIRRTPVLRMITKSGCMLIAAVLLWAGGVLWDAGAAAAPSAERGALTGLDHSTNQASPADQAHRIGTLDPVHSYHENWPPDKPSLASPAYGATGVCLTPTLQTWPFHDSNPGDIHLKTEWWIARDNTFSSAVRASSSSSTVLHTTSSTCLTSLTIPPFTLLEGTEYYWKVRFYDGLSYASDWSDAYSFTTKTTTTDLNGNGIPDELENNTVDLDQDGIPDIQQTDIKSLNTRVGGGQMGVSCRNAPNVTSIASIDSLDPVTISQIGRPSGMPLGLFPMRLNVKNPGDIVQVVIYFSEAAGPNATWLKYDPVNGWKDYTAHAAFSADRKSVTVELKDGGYGDADGVANGTITDPGGFGLASWVDGRITDAATGRGVQRAQVTVGDLTFRTDLSGNFLTMLLPGSYSFSVSATGYDTLKTSADVAEAQTATLEVSMTPSSQSHRLYYPHSATLYGWGTEIAAINTSDTQTANCTLNGYSDEGDLIDAIPITLRPHARSEVTISQAFTDPNSIGYLVLNSDIDGIKGYVKFYQQGQCRVAVPAVSYINSSDLYVSHISLDTAWWTGISLVNTTASAKDLTITFNNGEFQIFTLGANGHMIINIGKDYFNDEPRKDIQSAVISNASGVIGLELFGSLGWGEQLEGILLTDKTTSTIYYPHVATADDGEGWWTGIVAYNTSNQESTITITPYKVNGDPLTPITTSTIAGKGKYIRPTLTEPLTLPDETAWFKIDSAVQPLSGFELFGTVDGQRLGSYAGGGDTGKTEGIFPKIEKDGWTGIAFVNTEDGEATVTLTAYDDSGDPVATEVLQVGGHAKVVKTAESIFWPQDITAATYIAFSSDKRVVGFQLNNSLDNTMLDGLPGI